MSLIQEIKSRDIATDNLMTMAPGGRLGAIVPRNFAEVMDMASMFQASGMAPKSLGSAAKIAVAIQYGLEIGLPPIQAMQNIAVINGRPALWGDALPALMLKHGHTLNEKIEGAGDEMTATCTLIRGDLDQTTVRSFSMKEAKTAGLAGKDIWRKYPQRMLQMRARGWAIRDGAPDALVGLAVAEEVEDYGMKDVTPPSPDLTPAEALSPPSPTEPIEPDESEMTQEELLASIDDQMAGANDIDTLSEIWNEGAEEVDGAFDLYKKHEERIENG